MQKELETPLIAVLCLTAALSLRTTRATAQSAYEPFDYPAGTSIDGQNGGIGWAGPWAGLNDQIVAPGLTYPGLSTSGNALGPTGGPVANSTGQVAILPPHRALVAPIAGSAGMSLVLRALIESSGTPERLFVLGNTSGGDFVIGNLPSSDERAGNWGLANSAGNFYSAVPVAANITTCLAAQIDFSVTGPGSNDRMRLWVNPGACAVSSLSTTDPDVDVTNAHVAQFSGVFWQTQQPVVVDEIHVDVVLSAGEQHNAGTTFVLQRLGSLPPPQEVRPLVVQLTQDYCTSVGEDCHALTVPRTLPDTETVISRIKGSRLFRQGTEAIFSLIQDRARQPRSSLSLQRFQKSLDELEVAYSNQLVPTEAFQFSQLISVARSSGLFWAPQAEGGLGGIRALAAPVPHVREDDIDWGKVVNDDIIGCEVTILFGCVEDSIAFSVINILEQLLSTK